MAIGEKMKPTFKELTLEETSTWAVAVVCFVLLLISIAIEQSIHKIGTLLKKKRKTELSEALEKIKGELMLLGFISLILTVAQDPISNICIPRHVALYMRPCSADKYDHITGIKLNLTNVEKYKQENGQRLLIELAESYIPRRSLATKGYDNCANKGKVAFVSAYGIHQLHVFIFVLAVVHVVYCVLTYALGKGKMKKWKKWEEETKIKDDPEKFRFARETTFGKRHLSFWSKTSVTLWIVCFFRQIFGSVTKVDYLALRHGFVTKHVAPGTNSRYDFRKYVQRTLEKDFKTVVEISPVIWFVAVLCLLTNTNGLHAYLWLPFIPLAILLIVGTKLQVIITQMGLRIADKGDVVRGAPVVQPGDDLFWFNKPKFILYLIHLVLFTNAFQLAWLIWSTYAFTLKNCFHEKTADVAIRITVGVIVQILCSYVTLPLYALVTQMGSTLKPTVFTDGVATAIGKWHHTAKDHTKHGSHSEPHGSFTPTHGSSPVHLLHKSNSRSVEDSSNSRGPKYSSHDEHQSWDPESQHQKAEISTHHSRGHESSEKKPGFASMQLE